MSIIKLTLHNWMGALADSVKISQLSIPGTHNSCARENSAWGFAQCQTEYLSWQLNNGIRYLDIRCRNTQSIPTAPFRPRTRWYFAIVHGVTDQRRSFEEVLTACFTFLANNPTETIIMRVQQEGSSDSDRYKEIFRNYLNPVLRSKFYLGTTIPSLGQVRGKIVLLSALPWIEEGLWFLNQEIQDDHSNPSVSTKKEKIKQHISSSINSNGQKFYINHLSANGLGKSLWTPWSYAKIMNKYALGQIKNVFPHNTQLGVIVYDYAGASKGNWAGKDTILARAIIERNHFAHPPTGYYPP